MKTKGITIPQTAIDSGYAAMTGRFRALDIQHAVAEALRPLAGDGSFDYGRCRREELEMRVADSLIQRARRAGTIKLLPGSQWQGA